MTQQEYEALNAAVGPDDPPGLILHTSSKMATWMRVLDV